MRYQLILDTDFSFDIDTYCKENGIGKQDMIRQLIRREIYFTHYFQRPIKDSKKKYGHKKLG